MLLSTTTQVVATWEDPCFGEVILRREVLGSGYTLNGHRVDFIIGSALADRVVELGRENEELKARLGSRVPDAVPTTTTIHTGYPPLG